MSGHDFVDWPHVPTHEEHITVLASRPVQWITWPNVKPREVPAAERRSGPRASRFNDLEQA